MPPKILYLFPDTNLFIQCRPLEQLDWSTWKGFDEVQLIVSRPVQSEIDNQKKRGNDRVGKRARIVAGLFKKLILEENNEKVIIEKNPTVRLLIRPELKRSKTFEEQLDYSERDDQLVGTAREFQDNNPGADVRILTHDGGPLATAKMVGLSAAPIPDDWLLEPETTEVEKKLNSLTTELTRLKKAEPEFKISCVDEDFNPIEKLVLNIVRYDALSSGQVAELMQRIQTAFPVETDFGPKDPLERSSNNAVMLMLGAKETFKPATESEISDYRKEQKKWLDGCKTILSEYHERLEKAAEAISFTFIASNEGPRPAKDALITIKARGNFLVMPPPYRSSRDDDNLETHLSLPGPPNPPKGTWDRGTYARLMGGLEGFSGFGHGESFADLTGRVTTLKDLRPDPNAFFYKPARSPVPIEEFALECAQWRHGIEPESFRGEIHWIEDTDRLEGALECSIHAENMTNMAVARVTVAIEIKIVSAYDKAKLAVDNLIAS